MDEPNSAFGSSCSWVTCMDGCLTEYFQMITYIDFSNRTKSGSGEGNFFS